MATTIKLKNGSGAPSASDLVQGEPAIDLTNKRLYTENGSGAVIEVGSNPSSLSIAGTAITATAAELNILDGVTSTAAELNILDGVTSTAVELNILDGVTSTTAELNILDGVTASTAEINYVDITSIGTVEASKAIITDSNKDITGGRNITISGELDAGSLDVSGNADIDGTLETDALSINGTAVTSTAAELNILDGVTSTAAELNILDGVTSTAAELNILDGVTSTTAELNILDGVTSTAAELNILDGVTSTTAELNILDGVTSTAVELNILDGVTSTTAELNILDGVTSTAAELNIIDGNTTATSTTLADADRIVVNDNGTMVQVALTDFETYLESAIDTIGGNLTVTGDLTISGDDLVMATNTAGHLLIADGTNFNPTAVGDLSEISTVANDDVLMAVDTSGGGLKKITRSTLVAGLGGDAGISNVVEDTSPQLGGNLDFNGNTATSFTSTGIDDNATSTKLTVADSAITTGSIDQLIVAHSTDGGGIRIDSTNSTNTGSVRFGDDLDNYIGALEYNHTNNAMSMYVNNATRMTIDSSGNVGIGSSSNHAGARVVINDTPPTAFGNPMFQVGQETFTTSGIYSIGFGFTSGTYTEPPAEIAAVSTSASGGTTADIVFGTRSVTTNTAVTERMRINSSGNVQISTSAGNYTDALLTARNAGNCIDWGHTNTAGYGSTLGANSGSGAPFIGLSCGAGTNSNTFRTYGLKGSLLTTNNAGSLLFSRITTASADNQSPTESMRIDSSGNVGIGTSSINSSYRLNVEGAVIPILATASSTASSSMYACVAAARPLNTAGNGSGFGMNMNNSSGSMAEYGYIGGLIESNTAGSQSGALVFAPTLSGTRTESMRIDSSGNLMVNTAVQVNTAKVNFISSSTTNVLGLKNANDANYLITAYNSSASEIFRVAGTGNVLNTNNSYGSLSDERLKSNIVDASSQLDDIMAVQVRSYTLNETGETHIGVVAQELEASGMSGLVQEDKEGMKSVKYSILYVKAIKALQEAVTRIETLEAEVAALKGE